MLKIKDLKSGYNKMQILNGIDFKIDQREIIAIIGPNGAGKSTLLKSIFNLCEIYSGKIEFKNNNITRLPTHKLIHQGISYVPQGRQVFTSLSVKENLEMGAFVLKTDTESKISKIYDFFPYLKDRQNDLAGNLSGGQQQMLAIGRALMQNPKLLLLDEPSLGLSPKIMKEVFAKIIEINQQGVAVIIVEQNAKQAVKISDRTYVLENGKIALTGGKEILSHPKIKTIYFGG